MCSISRRPAPPSRRLDLSALHEAGAIADLVDDEASPPDPLEMILAPILTHWSLTRGRVLIGVDEWGAVLAMDAETFAPDLIWARTSQGLVKLGARSPLPLKPEAH